MQLNFFVSSASRRRDGCSECRRKKAKCDLKKPVCSRCLRSPTLCTYKNFVDCSQSLISAKKSQIQPAAATLPQTMTQTISRHLIDDQSRFLIHHFSTQTVALLFPLAPPRFSSQLLSTALDAPCLLYALLASSSSHYARLTFDQSMQRTTLKYTNLAINSLRTTLAAQGSVEIEHVAAAIALCTNDICNGSLDSYRAHLAGARHLLQVLRSTQPARADPSFTVFLLKWFSTLDVSASASGTYSSVASDSRHPMLDLLQRPSTLQIDDFCGYSLEIMPLISSIGKIAKSRHIGNTDLTLFNNHVDIESQILALSCPAASTVSEDAEQPGREIELKFSHEAFIGAALLHLYRRIHLLPKDHPKVRLAIAKIISAVSSIPHFSLITILLLWPLFSAGCETDCIEERIFIDKRMENMQSLGLGNFMQARSVMNAYWSSGAHMTWVEYLEHSGLLLVLF